ncbi:SIMPL domain-containing protein [Kribbella steppae]|nr:SIMPL domain-containing protein [Kribbella steppae]
MDTGVSVVGSGQVSAPADVLRMALSVGHDAADVATAVAQVADRTDAVLAALRQQGVEAADIATSSVNVHPQYKEMGSPGGYHAAHTLTVRTKDLTGFGRLLNAAVDAAGNSLGLDFLQFDIEEKTPLLTQARELAFRQARTKAQELAGLAGYSLGSVTSISESYSHAPFQEQSQMLGKGFDAPLNISPGAQTIELSLEVHFSWA